MNLYLIQPIGPSIEDIVNQITESAKKEEPLNLCLPMEDEDGLIPVYEIKPKDGNFFCSFEGRDMRFDNLDGVIDSALSELFDSQKQRETAREIAERAARRPSFHYALPFTLNACVDDIAASNEYLSKMGERYMRYICSEIRPYLSVDGKKALDNSTNSLTWKLDDAKSGHISLDTNRVLTTKECAGVVSLLMGHSDNVMNGFNRWVQKDIKIGVMHSFVRSRTKKCYLTMLMTRKHLSSANLAMTSGTGKIQGRQNPLRQRIPNQCLRKMI